MTGVQNAHSGRPLYHERPSGVKQRLRLEEETGSRVAQRSEQGAHNSHAAGSNPAPATNLSDDITREAGANAWALVRCWLEEQGREVPVTPMPPCEGPR